MASLMQDAIDYASAALGSKKKETTVWMDGAFDVMHFGHANAFRQGRTLGTRLVVGVIRCLVEGNDVVGWEMLTPFRSQGKVP